MHEFLKKIYRAIIKKLPTKMVLNIENFRGYKRLFKEDRIEYFGEKIQWMKLYGNLERYRDLVDKYTVREYIASTIGKEFLIDIIDVYDSPEEIEFEKLPDKFVLKLNTGSGYNIICPDKTKLDKKKTIKTLKKWLQEDYYKIKKEPQYKNIEKKIICEKYMADKNGTLLDYKLYCFGGKVEFIEVDFDRFENHTMNFYDIDWNLLNLQKGKYKTYTGKVEKPKKLDEMISIAEKLSHDLPLARIDLYYIEDKIYFGEITLTPAGGVTAFKPLDKDKEYADKIKLEKHSKTNILLLASIGKDNERLDGETIKNRLLKEYLEKQGQLNICTVDTHNWRKNALKIAINILKSYLFANKIVISASQGGAVKIIRFFNFMHSKKTIYFFLIGGSLSKHIEEGKHKVKDYQNIHRIYVESEILKDDLNRQGLNNVEVIPNFREKAYFENKYRKSNRIRFVFFGRVIKVKGIEQSIELIKKLTDNRYTVSLDIYGQVEEEYLEILKKMMRGYDNIQYCGVITPNNKNEYEILSQYDVFILPTEHLGEGLPGALIDSYIAGLAVLVSNWKYAKEYVQDNENGYIFEYKNYEDMYDKAVQMIEKNKINEFKEQSLKLAHNYIIDDVLKNFISEIEDKE